MSVEIAIGNFLDLNVGGSRVYRWQNFWIKETVSGYSFVPYGFSGLTSNRQGDNIDATLVFPNNELSRQWALTATKEQWVARVKVIMFNPENRSEQTVLHTYIGQITSAGWGETAVNVRLNSIIDAVGGDIPARRLTQRLVGAIPTSSNIQLS